MHHVWTPARFPIRHNGFASLPGTCERQWVQVETCAERPAVTCFGDDPGCAVFGETEGCLGSLAASAILMGRVDCPRDARFNQARCAGEGVGVVVFLVALNLIGFTFSAQFRLVRLPRS